MSDRATRWQVLFGDLEGFDDWDDFDEGDRMVFVENAFPLGTPAQSAMQLTLVNQVLDGEPAVTWKTLERLVDDGLTVDSALGQMRMVLLQAMRAALDGDGFDDDGYRADLERLPLPDADAIEDAFDRVAATARVIDSDELIDRVMDELGGDPGDALLRHLVERVDDDMLMTGFGTLQWLSGGRTAHRRALTAGIVLTHVLTEHERVTGELDVTVDLAGFVGLVDPSWADAGIDEDDELVLCGDGRWTESWAGYIGWLERYPAGSTLAVRVDDDERVSFEVLPSAPEVDDEVVDLLRRVVEAEGDEPESSTELETVVLGMLAERRDMFATPQAPLSDLVEAAGVERRGSAVVSDPEHWRNDALLRRYGRVHRAAEGDEELSSEALSVLEVCDQLVLGEPVEEDELHSAVESLTDPDVFDLVSKELFVLDHETPPTPELFTQLASAARRTSLAAVHTLAALGCEHEMDPHAAEQHLELAMSADPDYVQAVDRLAWYASDRGDARKAKRLWSNLCGPGISVVLAELEPFTRTGKTLGRNDPCWCGSGRKYKQCHLGEPMGAPLPDRVGWLYRKALQYLERRGPDAWRTLSEIAMVLADYDQSRLDDVFEDPIVLDLALTEGGWFEQFLDDRGPLLPDDEAMLAGSWLTVDRSVHEVITVDPGIGVQVRDLRTGDVLGIRERTFSRDARPGVLVCARAVPDGETNQFVGAVLTVPVGQEADVLDLLDDGDPLDIASWAAAQHRPPQLRTREGEVVVQCDIVVENDDLGSLVRHLDRTYQTDEKDGAWSEHHDLNEDEGVVRATFHLDGGQLHISTNSHERADRILERLDRAVTVTVVVDDRVPVDLADGVPGARPLGLPDLRRVSDAMPVVGSAELAELTEQISDQFERRWCDESVPALGGLTPRGAVADPTRREQVVRLIDSFEGHEVADGAFTMRPQRLRELLGL